MLIWPAKDPNEFLDYEVDWTARLEDGETITTSGFSVVEGTVVIDSEPGQVAGVTKVWLSGGTEGELCVILNRITTSVSRTYDQSMKLRIRTK